MQCTHNTKKLAVYIPVLLMVHARTIQKLTIKKTVLPVML